MRADGGASGIPSSGGAVVVAASFIRHKDEESVVAGMEKAVVGEGELKYACRMSLFEGEGSREQSRNQEDPRTS